MQFTSDGLLRIRDGRLLFAQAVHGDQLCAAARRARSLGPGHPQSIELAGADGRTAATLQVQVLDFGASPDLPVSEVLLLEVHEKAPIERGLQRLCNEYLLTRKEAECAIGLYAMGSLDEFARCAGKSIHTVRSQIKAAMQKTSTHTQAGLVALVAARLGS
jgi:DNA-binding CsgD family transcriptional regulator